MFVLLLFFSAFLIDAVTVEIKRSRVLRIDSAAANLHTLSKVIPIMDRFSLSFRLGLCLGCLTFLSCDLILSRRVFSPQTSQICSTIVCNIPVFPSMSPCKLHNGCTALLLIFLFQNFTDLSEFNVITC